MTEFYAGLDVSDKTTHICTVGPDGKVAWRGVCVTDPEIIATQLNAHCPGVTRASSRPAPCRRFYTTA